MLNIIVFSGGLGNQMFQYAFYMALKKRHVFCIFAFDIRDSKVCHNGFELFRIFGIRNQLNCKLFSLLSLCLNSLIQRFYVEKQRNSLVYYPSIMEQEHCFIKYEGFWQSPLYFREIEPLVRKKYRFDKKLLNQASCLLLEKLEREEWCSVHIRRGDYLTESIVGVCSIEYYQKAMAHITATTGCANFCFFSDDIDWVKENLSTDHAIYVDWNHKEDSWQDMYLMSQCKHNIIANSSFSWWGGWLNANMNKVVVAPKKWFLNAKIDDIIPASWVRM